MNDMQMQTKWEKWSPWLIAGVGILYTVSPFDLIPDIPFVGWVDDFFILSSSLLYLLESQTGKISKPLLETIRLLRMISLWLGCISILLLLIFTTMVVGLLS